MFEILSNSIDEAREGHGSLITVTRFQDRSIQVEDQGRGCPVDWNEEEGRYNWSWCSARCTPEASTTPPGKTMSSPWA